MEQRLCERNNNTRRGEEEEEKEKKKKTKKRKKKKSEVELRGRGGGGGDPIYLTVPFCGANGATVSSSKEVPLPFSPLSL